MINFFYNWIRIKIFCEVRGAAKLLLKGTIFPHPYSIIIPKGVRIGNNVNIAQNTTIGAYKNGLPTIGDRTKIYPNCIIFGGITIGSNVVIGAGSVVNKNVPSGVVIAGNPAKIIRYSYEEDLL